MLRDSLTVEKDARVSGNADVGRNLTVSGTSTLNGDVTMQSNATVGRNLHDKGTSQLDGSTRIGSESAPADLDVTGNAAFGTGSSGAGGSVVIGNAARRNGSLAVNGTARISGNTSIGDNEHCAELTLGSAGRGNGRLTVNGNASFGASGQGGTVVIGNPDAMNGRLVLNGSMTTTGGGQFGRVKGASAASAESVDGSPPVPEEPKGFGGGVAKSRNLRLGTVMRFLKICI